ncbi:MAG: hypothetical protein OXH75_22075 [Acidobacteria bacterium]|nr:hypothetical protein [Acidobacteriota bacterium]
MCPWCAGRGGWLQEPLDDGDPRVWVVCPGPTGGTLESIVLPGEAAAVADRTGAGRPSVEWARAWRRALRRLAAAGSIPAAAAESWAASAEALERARR